MAYVPLADQDSEMEMHHPHSWVTKYVWSQDHKVIAIQYGGLAIAVGVVALVLSLLMRMQLGFPETFDLIDPSSYYQSVTMHGMIMVVYMLTALLLGGFGNYLIPLMCGARDMVFPFLNMLSVWVYALSVLILMSSFFVERRTDWGRVDFVSSADCHGGHTGTRHGHRLDAVVSSRVHRCLHNGRPELRDYNLAVSLPRLDHDASSSDCLGNLYRDNSWPVCFPSAACFGNHDALRYAARH